MDIWDLSGEGIARGVEDAVELVEELALVAGQPGTGVCFQGVQWRELELQEGTP